MKKIFAFVLLLLGSIAVMAQSNDTLYWHFVEVDPDIVHGTLNVRPTGEVQTGTRVRVSAVPDPNYVLESITVYNIQVPDETVELVDDHFVMPDFDVIVTASFVDALPVIVGDIVAPAAICDGESLSLTPPRVQNATEQGWLLCPDTFFQMAIPYTGQPLEVSYDGWKLCYWASNGTSRVLSNIVGIRVTSFINPSDLNAIVAKKHNGKDYILIYPNPKDTYRYQWYKDGQKIAGANGQYYYPKEGLADGEYQVYLSFNADAQGQLFCGAFSTVYAVRNSKEMFSIYPNPSSISEVVTVNNESEQEAMMSIFGLDGKLLYSQQVSSGMNEISIRLPQGLYFCHFSDASGNHNVQKLVVQ